MRRGLRIADAYAAADTVVLFSTWEGFGLPLIESALAGRPLAVSEYPVAREVERLGVAWFPSTTRRRSPPGSPTPTQHC